MHSYIRNKSDEESNRSSQLLWFDCLEHHVLTFESARKLYPKGTSKL
jgi:hypothetical protein